MLTTQLNRLRGGEEVERDPLWLRWCLDLWGLLGFKQDYLAQYMCVGQLDYPSACSNGGIAALRVLLCWAGRTDTELPEATDLSSLYRLDRGFQWGPPEYVFRKGGQKLFPTPSAWGGSSCQITVNHVIILKWLTTWWGNSKMEDIPVQWQLIWSTTTNTILSNTWPR